MTVSSVGSAWVRFKDPSGKDIEEKEQFKLSDECSVLQAELLAILKAMENAMHRSIPTFHVCSDSFSALKAIQERSSKNVLVHRVHTLLEVRNLQVVHFNWLKVHSGILGNERADAIAKQAASSERGVSWERYPRSRLEAHFQEQLLHKWDARYLSELLGGRYVPSVRLASRLYEAFPPDWITTQDLTGHGAFRSYLHSRKRSARKDCECGREEQDAVHLIESCPLLHWEELDYLSKRERAGNSLKKVEEFMAFVKVVVAKAMVLNKSRYAGQNA